MRKLLIVLLATLILAFGRMDADARVVRLVVERTTPYADGEAIGTHGPFERLAGTVYMVVDPEDPVNAVIVNLDKAPRNAEGLVEFSAPFVIIKPVDVTRGNRKILYGINNRGNNIEISFHAYPAPALRALLGSSTETDDQIIFRLGYTFVDAGWAGDITTTEARLGAHLPVAREPDGSAVVSRVRIEYSSSGYTLPLKGNDRFRSYETADTDPAISTLTVRDGIEGRRVPIAPDEWAFGRCPTGRLSLEATTTDICLFEGFDPDRIYELMYPAKGAWVMGLGYAVTRDLASFLRYAAVDDAGNRNPLAESETTLGVRRVYGFGISSTGMYLRDFLYLGFNEDESARQVFDAVRILIPGTHRLMANIEFSDPNVYSRQDQHADFTSSSYPPLTYAVTSDPISGLHDGILKRPATDPLVFHVDTANEFWQMNASLNVHDGRGEPVPIPDNVRLYYIANHSHVGASGVAARPTDTGTCAYPVNGNRSYATVLRALIVALDAWADGGVAPPPSVYPEVGNGTLVRVAEAAAAFPAIPGVTFPRVVNELDLLDFGPAFGSTGGHVTELPPLRRGRYQVLVPKPDADGIDAVGIRTVDVAAPVGTNIGWNLRAPGPRGMDLCGLSGAFIPFAETRADRVANGDPRRSLQERYGDHAGFVAAVERATDGLLEQRFLLAEDAEVIIGLAEESNILAVRDEGSASHQDR